MRSTLRSLFSGALSFALFGASLAAPSMLAVNFDGQLTRFNPTTGESSVIGTVSVPGPNAMAMSPEGILYVGGFTTPRTLSRVDWSNASSVQTITTTLGDIRDMAFVGSTLYGILNGSPDQLVTINTTTGATTVVGSMGDASMQALAALPNGVLYGWSVNVGLVTINTATGLATDVNPGLVGTAIQGMAFERDGRLFGVAGSGVYEIDRTTGAQTDTGIDFGDSRGATLLPRSYRLMMGAASGGSGQRFIFDTATMQVTNVFGSTGATAGFVGLPNADIYHLSGITLIRMDAGNAAITTVGTLPGSGRDLAWDGTQLYGVFSNQLHRIDKDTAATTLVGATGFMNITGLAALGTSMYAWDTVQGLLLVNKATGAAADVNAGIAGITGIEDLEPLPDGTLLGVGDKVYVINPSTGAFTVRGGPWTGIVGGAGLITDNARMISTTLASPFTGRVVTDRLGTMTNIGWNATAHLSGMGFGDDGYTYGSVGIGTDRLVRVNVANGVCTDFGPIGVLSNPAGLVWHDGELHFIQSGSDRLTRYDFLTDSFVDVFVYPGSASGLVRHPAGTFLSWDLSAATPGMSRFDPTTSSATIFSGLSTGPSKMAGYPDGVTVGINATGVWQTVEPMTGAFVNGPVGPQAGSLAYIGEQFTLNANPQDFVGNPKTIMLEVEFRHPGSSIAVERRKMRMENLSTTHVGTFLRGRYDVSFKASHWLRKTLNSVYVDGGVTFNSTMVNGDINNDNRIDSDDYDILVAQFGSSGPEADVDGSGTVDSDDFDILVKNFGDIGDN